MSTASWRTPTGWPARWSRPFGHPDRERRNARRRLPTSLDQILLGGGTWTRLGAQRMFRPAGTATFREGASQPLPNEDRRSGRTRVSLEGKGQPVAICRHYDLVAAAIARLAAPVLARQGFLRFVQLKLQAPVRQNGPVARDPAFEAVHGKAGRFERGRPSGRRVGRWEPGGLRRRSMSP